DRGPPPRGARRARTPGPALRESGPRWRRSCRHHRDCRDPSPLCGRLDVAAPTTALGAATLDVLLEALEVTLHAPIEEAQGGPHVLDHALGIDVHLEGHPGGLIVDAMERHHASVLGPGGGVPG